MISTETAATSAKVNAGSGPTSNHTTNVAIAMNSTAGTNQRATASASRWIGALDVWAWRTRRTIWASIVSRPTLVARMRNAPVWFSVAPMTTSPARLGRPASTRR